MQVLGKRSRSLLIAVAIAMLVAVGVSFTMWDMSAVKATNGDLSSYANANVGDIIEFGKYYQTGNIDEKTGEYEKTTIEWIVVDKDERTGQLTLMSKHILAAGSYFGNVYYNIANEKGSHFDNNVTIGGISYNQAYVESTARAFLNNLERFDVGGDTFDATIGYYPSKKHASASTGLYASVGFSNQRFWTGLNTGNAVIDALVANPASGLIKRFEADNTEVYYQRPINNSEYKARPATRGFYDEAFSDYQKSLIVPKVIAGYTGHRWPDSALDIAAKGYVEGAYDKVWLASATELNIMNGRDWNNQGNDAWTNPSDESSSSVFQYFMNYSEYINPVTNKKNNSVSEAIRTIRTKFAERSFAANYSIPMYNQLNEGETDLSINTDIHAENNSSDHYWTRSPSSPGSSGVRTVLSSGLFTATISNTSHVGVRPCIILKY